jgi:hypothetical protein
VGHACFESGSEGSRPAIPRPIGQRARLTRGRSGSGQTHGRRGSVGFTSFFFFFFLSLLGLLVRIFLVLYLF